MPTDSITRPVMQNISISTAGDNIIVASNPSQYIYIRQLLLTTPGGAQVIKIKDGSLVKSTFSINANDGLVLENTQPDYPFLFDIKPGNDFIINLSAGTSVTGHVVFGYRK